MIAEISAVLTTCPATAGSTTPVTVTVAEPAEVRSPRSQSTLCPVTAQDPAMVEATGSVTAAGTASITCTDWAVDGPLLVAVNW